LVTLILTLIAYAYFEKPFSMMFCGNEYFHDIL
jgi:hypothetical protein